MREIRNVHKILVCKLEEYRPLEEYLGVDGRILLKLILGKQVWRVWIGLIWLRIGTGGRLF
jgi:hypothetical protein